jgi:hypothetical protein
VREGTILYLVDQLELKALTTSSTVTWSNFDELYDAIKYLAKNKAPGPDFISNELWKALSVAQRLNLLRSINRVWRDQCIPVDVSYVTMKPVYTKGSVSDPSNLSLVNTCHKLLTSMMTVRLTIWCDKHSKIV